MMPLNVMIEVVILLSGVPGAVPVDAKAAELKFWTKNDGQV